MQSTDYRVDLSAPPSHSGFTGSLSSAVSPMGCNTTVTTYRDLFSADTAEIGPAVASLLFVPNACDRLL